MNDPAFPDFSHACTRTVVGDGTLPVHHFDEAGSGQRNIDPEVVRSFGQEWEKFGNLSPEETEKMGRQYFDIVPEAVLNPSARCLDVGCGSGRWTRFVAPHVATVDAVDPSSAAYVAAKACAGFPNVRVSVSSADDLPFHDETFDFVFSLGVLHHVPDTAKALAAVARKAKKGGHVLIYLYYALDGRPLWFKAIFAVTDFLRRRISKLPERLKVFACDVIAAVVYFPIARFGALLGAIGVPKRIVELLPLSYYQHRTFFVMRNDSLDRFGTTLEQRFTRPQIIEMMTAAGLGNIVVSDGQPYWHAIGEKI